MKTAFAVTDSTFGESTPAANPGVIVNARRATLTSQLVQCLFILSVALLSYLVITHFVLQTVKVVGESMTPTLQDTRLYVLNRMVYFFRSPQPADVVVIRDPADHGFCVKRIIARAGDVVAIHHGKVFVNNHPLNEPYLPQGTPTYPNGSGQEQLFQLAANEFFLLGDNRLNSSDSRTYGPVTRDYILGQVIY
jgi:signal peptidase I